MRRKQRLVKTIRAAVRTTRKNDFGEVIGEGWTEPVEMQATVTPLNDALSVEMYGERANTMLRVICPGGLHKGMGVWLDDGDEPKWKIVSAEAWPNHMVATIEAVV